MGRLSVVLLVMSLAVGTLHCGSGEGDAPTPQTKPTPAPKAAAVPVSTPDSLPRALVLSLARFGATAAGQAVPVPLPGSMEFLVRRDGEWQVIPLEDEGSNVIHKAMEYSAPGQAPTLLAAAGSAATLKAWTPAGSAGPTAEVLWEKDFGGKFSRMRDIEVADLYAEGKPSIAVATHDQGVVATLRPTADGFSVQELHQEADTFVHEVEIGDVDGDGTLEVYATPSEPNRLDGSEQSGRVDRYVPAKNEGPTVAADLGKRHAKEILVEDVDGNGRDELYVVVEGKASSSGALEHGVEVRRYEADTPADGGVVVAGVQDRLARFLTAGDIDGDGKKELVLAAFSSGVWLLRPDDDPMDAWTVTNIDRRSGGFEHAALLTDLDEDGRDELYVASDNDNEVRRYVWDGTRMVREVIYKRTGGMSVFTWNIMPVSVGLVPE